MLSLISTRAISRSHHVGFLWIPRRPLIFNSIRRLCTAENTDSDDEPEHLQYSSRQFRSLDSEMPLFESTRTSLFRKIGYAAVAQFVGCVGVIPWLAASSGSVAARAAVGLALFGTGAGVLAGGNSLLRRYITDLTLLPGGTHVRMGTMTLLGKTNVEFPVRKVYVEKYSEEAYTTNQAMVVIGVTDIRSVLLLDLGGGRVHNWEALEYVLFHEFERIERPEGSPAMDLGRKRALAAQANASANN